jgi:hypothetical protein
MTQGDLPDSPDLLPLQRTSTRVDHPSAKQGLIHVLSLRAEYTQLQTLVPAPGSLLKLSLLLSAGLICSLRRQEAADHMDNSVVLHYIRL